MKENYCRVKQENEGTRYKILCGKEYKGRVTMARRLVRQGEKSGTGRVEQRP